MFILVLGRAMQMLIMFATYRLLSSFFSTEVMSSYFFLLSIAGFFGLMVANPLGLYLYRIIHRAKNEKDLNSLLNFFASIMSILSLLIFPIVLIVKYKIGDNQLNIYLIALIMLLYVLGTTFNGTFVSILNILAFNNMFVAVTIATASMGLILSVFLVKFVVSDPIIWLLGQSISFVLFGILAFILIRKNIDQDQKSYHLNKKEIFAFSTPILVTNIFVWIMSQSFRFFLKGSVDDSLLGEMAFGLGLASALAVAVEYLFQQLLFPGFYSALNDSKNDRERSWNNLFLKSAPAYICLIAYMLLLSPFVMNVLADVKFKGSYKYLALGAVVELFRMLGNMVNMAYQSEMKTRKSIGSYALGGGVTLIGIILISKNVDYLKFTPFVLILGQILIFTSLIYNLQKLITINFPLKRLLKYVLMCTPFIGATFLNKNMGIVPSLLICGIFGLYLLFLFYQIQKEENV